MKRIFTAILILGVLVLLAVTTSCASQAAVESSVKTVAIQPMQSIEAYGTVEAEGIENITLDFQAPVTKVYIKEGERVKAGQPLVSLDLSEMTSQMEDKQLELEAARKDMGLNLPDAGPDMDKLKNDLKSAQEVFNRDNAELDSKQKLYAAGSISFTELDAAKKLVDSDNKSIDDAAFAIESLKNSKNTENLQKNTTIIELESNLKLLGDKLGKPYLKGSDIVSDVADGVVCDIGCVDGDIAGPDKKILSIMDLNSLVIVAEVPEEFIKDVKLGAKAVIVPTADKSRQYKGTVTFISGKAIVDNGETFVPVTIEIGDRDDFLLPGFNVDVNITEAVK